MQLAQWIPLREMEDLFSHLQRSPGRGLATAAAGGWAPVVDITENDKEYAVKAELPGVKKEDVKVLVENGVLTLSGERKYEKDDKDEKSHRIERFYGRFERSFSVPDDVLSEKIAAECKEGIVTVHLPKTHIKKAVSAEIKVQ